MADLVYKYIIVKEGAMLFQEGITHSQTAGYWIDMGLPIFSAGFCKVSFCARGVREVICWGKSDSLNTDSKPGIDGLVILDFFQLMSKTRYNLWDIPSLYK